MQCRKLLGHALPAGRRRYTALRAATLAAAILLTQVAVQLATATPAAAALSGLYQPPPVSSASDTQPVKLAVNRCTGNGRVAIGGGGVIVGGQGTGRVRLTGLYPLPDGTGFQAVAALPHGAPIPQSAWRLDAYVVCANRPSGYVIRSEQRQSGLDSQDFKLAAAVCPSGKRVIGSGAHIGGSGDAIRIAGLQLTRASGPLDITWAAAREDVAYSGNWSLFSHAICADPIGAAVHDQVYTNSGIALSVCPGLPATPKYLHGAGGGGRLTDQGPIFLRYIRPTLTSVEVAMTGSYPGGIVASAVCA